GVVVVARGAEVFHVPDVDADVLREDRLAAGELSGAGDAIVVEGDVVTRADGDAVVGRVGDGVVVGLDEGWVLGSGVAHPVAEHDSSAGIAPVVAPGFVGGGRGGGSDGIGAVDGVVVDEDGAGLGAAG